MLTTGLTELSDSGGQVLGKAKVTSFRKFRATVPERDDNPVRCLYLSFVLLGLFACVGFAAQDPGWPRSIDREGARLIYYQPQVDDWKDQKELYARMAVSLTPAGGQQVIGVVSLRLKTDVDPDDHTALLSTPEITRTYFPSLDPQTAKETDSLVRRMINPSASMTISLERLVASVDKSDIPKQTIQVKNDPPKIFVSYAPAILLQLDDKPVKAPIKNTKLESIMNANWRLFFEKKGSKYYLLVGKLWLTASELNGPWQPTAKLPKDMSKLVKDANWEDLKGTIPPPSTGSAKPPEVYYSETPSELILFEGQPVYSKIQNTQLVFATNTESDLLVDSAANVYYFLTSGRWFSAPDLKGPWTFASDRLPKDFKRIPSDSPAARVLMSVPGTPEAEDAVLIAEIPTTVKVNPVEAAKNVKVSYNGDPQFKPIEGTSLSYATNTGEKVIKVGDLYYLCFQGIWFKSTTPQGPWQTAESVPKDIYSIPPSCPVHNVTYVHQTKTESGDVESSYTAGYLGTFVAGLAVGAIITGGTGWYYPPYVYYPPFGYPVYRPYPVTYGVGYYNPYTRTYGYGRSVYGPYGGAHYRTGYNPRTGTYGRGATAYGPYGSRSAGRAYNPYTGAHGATRQGSNVYSQWGTTAVTRGGQTAVGRHYSNARGTVGSVTTSSGGRAVGASGAYGNTYAGKTAGGDLYAGKNGNVYRNANGNWQQYNNGNWNSVNTTQSQAQAQERVKNAQKQRTTNQGQPTTAQQPRSTAQQRVNQSASSSEFQGVQQDYQNRQRGTTETRNVQSSRRGSSGGFRSGGSRSGGGRRR